MPATLLKTSDLSRTPWKNGLGTTREIARGGEGPDGWSWRLSLADVEQDNAFSLFPGCERTLALLSGDGLSLRVDGAPPVLLQDPLALVRFSGDVETYGTLHGGPTVDFNVITRRDEVEHEVVLMRPGLVVTPADTAVLLLVEGRLTAPIAMEAGYVALLDDVSSPWTLAGEGRGLVVRLRKVV